MKHLDLTGDSPISWICLGIFDSFVTEDDDCWKSLPPNVFFIHIVVQVLLSSTELVHTNTKNQKVPSSDYGGKIGGLTFHQHVNSRLIHLNPTKTKFLADDGTDIILNYFNKGFNITPPADLPYSKVQFDTKFSPTLALEHPPNFCRPRSCYNRPPLVFRYPKEQMNIPFFGYPYSVGGFWLHYPSHSDPPPMWISSDNHFNYPLRVQPDKYPT
ncbi:unnamed protein product [Ambrosiozyma monospora]|uniref:Unnamed protein product n=1 Tax=Ambrosiozyma monospora TaxID=43982 RepID=A0ACB5SY01_AMBMO|nr:unnamed protein product [Ambrosiozyma monospora]